MKRTIILTTIITMTTVFSMSVFGQTTMEEYNYVVKGYKIQLESGLDMKNGYRLVDIDWASITANERKATLKALIKTSTEEIVAYMVIYKKNGQATEYICIPQPHSETEITDLFWEALYNGEGDSSYRLQLICYVLSKISFGIG